MLTSMDTNTEGGPTRIVTSGVPRLKGASVGEKMAHFKTRYDYMRDGLLKHPRGYPGMFGAVFKRTLPSRCRHWGHFHDQYRLSEPDNRKFEGRLAQPMKNIGDRDVFTENSGSAQTSGFHHFILG